MNNTTNDLQIASYLSKQYLNYCRSNTMEGAITLAAADTKKMVLHNPCTTSPPELIIGNKYYIIAKELILIRVWHGRWWTSLQGEPAIHPSIVTEYFPVDEKPKTVEEDGTIAQQRQEHIRRTAHSSQSKIQAKPELKQFGTGATRTTDGDDTRYDLITPIGLRHLAETYAEGFKKYGADNWKKGIPNSNLLNHAIRHIELWREGDRSEDHLAHAAWNLFTLIHFEETGNPAESPPKENPQVQPSLQPKEGTGTY
jgi:hypothetical protein